MASVGCVIKLAIDSNDPYAVRRCDLTISGTRHSGAWTVGSDSPDPRLNIGVGDGLWSLNANEDRTNTLYLFREDDYKILLEFYGLPADFLDRVTCGTDWNGRGWHQGPPTSDILYRLWFGCV